MKSIVLAWVALVLFVGVADGRTWWVKKDGTGDFTVIQDAVDVAASGDTIRIGPGLFTEFRVWSFPSGISAPIHIAPMQAEITFIGSGMTETFIGQAQPWDVSQIHHQAFYATDYFGATRLTIEDLCIQNSGRGVASWLNEVIVRRCRFIDCDIALSILNHPSSGLYVYDSVFDDIARDNLSIYTNWLAVAEIRNCAFEYGPSTWGRWFVSFNNTDRAIIDSCTFRGGEVGIQVEQSSSATIINCLLDGQSIIGLQSGVYGCRTAVRHCTFRNQRRAILLEAGTLQFTMSDCVVENVTESSVSIVQAPHAQINACDLAKGAQYAIIAHGAPPAANAVQFDFTDNYWGTDDANEIRAMIYDRHAHGGTVFEINFEPFRSGTTPVDKRSLSEIKNLFRIGGTKK